MTAALIAARWYFALPQLFLREVDKVKHRDAVIQQRLANFLTGDYVAVISSWRKEVNAGKARRSSARSPPKPITAEKKEELKLDYGIKLFYSGFVSKALQVIEGLVGPSTMLP